MKFVANTIQASEGRYKYKAIGDLTVKDVTMPLVISFNYAGEIENPMSKSLAYSFDGTFNINRVDFHVGDASPMVGSEVTVNFSAEAYKK